VKLKKKVNQGLKNNLDEKNSTRTFEDLRGGKQKKQNPEVRW
jgi:hypothetical protein